MSESDIISGLINQDRKVQNYLFNKWYRYLYVVAFSVVKNQMDTEDVLQISFVKIFDKVGQFTPDNSFKAWMSIIVKNTAISYYNNNKKYQNYDDIEGFEPMQVRSTNFCDAFMAAEQFHEAYKILKKNAPWQGTIFRLYAIEGMTHEEIAKDIEISESTSKSQYMRACRKLQMLITEMDTLKNEYKATA
jgi:RNA polymerase sigma factor (sigma-70 family)